MRASGQNSNALIKKISAWPGTRPSATPIALGEDSVVERRQTP